MNIQEDPRWAVLTQRLKDDSFFYSVKTTGVYCRSNCSSRLARPENVRFHASPAEAEAAGFRPCKRCLPNQSQPSEQQTALIAQACRNLEESLEPPDLKSLAKSAGLSQFHFHRLFKRTVGLTPGQYLRALRAEKLRQKLAGAASVTEAVFEAGYQSSSRFYEHSQDLLGMKPALYRQGGGRLVYSLHPGKVTEWTLIAMSARGVCAIFLGSNPDQLLQDLRQRFPQAQLSEACQDSHGWINSALAAVDENQAADELPLDVRGTVFQQKVWEALRQIPAGQTRTYTQIANHVGQPRAVRAVASACAANPIAIAIPCHRAIRSDGSLAGYRWGGPEIKRALLDREL